MVRLRFTPEASWRATLDIPKLLLKPWAAMDGSAQVQHSSHFRAFCFSYSKLQEYVPDQTHVFQLCLNSYRSGVLWCTFFMLPCLWCVCWVSQLCVLSSLCARCSHGSVQSRVSWHSSTVVDIRHVVFSCFCVVMRTTDSRCAFPNVHAFNGARSLQNKCLFTRVIILIGLFSNPLRDSKAYTTPAANRSFDPTNIGWKVTAPLMRHRFKLSGALNQSIRSRS